MYDGRGFSTTKSIGDFGNVGLLLTFVRKKVSLVP